MKQLMVILAAVFFVGCQEMPNPTGFDLYPPDAKYEVDGWGSNPDFYEFTPVGNPDYMCIWGIAGSDKYVQMECFPKAQKKAP